MHLVIRMQKWYNEDTTEERSMDMEWIVTAEDNGKTVLEFIRGHIAISTKLLKYLKYRNDGILVNGERCTVRRRLETGDRLTLAMEDRASAEELLPVELPISILYEDDALVIPSKPARMPTHPSHGHRDDTVANALAYHYQTQGIPFVFRPVNRLDRDTSGLLLIAKNKLSAGILTASMQKGLIRKRYLAVLLGEMTQHEGEIALPLHRREGSIILREVCSSDAPDAEPSLTRFRTLARGGGCTLVEASPITGRTHQLRVHFASLGHPILGDTLYGQADPRIDRQALHAHTLTLPHPTTGEEMTVRAPLYPDMEALIASCFPLDLCIPKE